VFAGSGVTVGRGLMVGWIFAGADVGGFVPIAPPAQAVAIINIKTLKSFLMGFILFSVRMGLNYNYYGLHTRFRTFYGIILRLTLRHAKFFIKSLTTYFYHG
jgi:hypothetical protein